MSPNENPGIKGLPSPFCTRIRVHFILQTPLAESSYLTAPCVFLSPNPILLHSPRLLAIIEVPPFLFKNPDSIFSFNFLLKIFSMSKGYKQSHKCPLILVGLHLGLSACLLPLQLLTMWLLWEPASMAPVPWPDCWWVLQEPRQGAWLTLIHSCGALLIAARWFPAVCTWHKAVSRGRSLKISGKFLFGKN